LIVSESGLYKLIFTSRLPKANDFRRWVAHDVLPSIRKTGCYALGKAQNDPHNSSDHDTAHRSFETVLGELGLTPDVLLNLLFEDKIPETGHPTYRFFAADACAALGIAQAEVPIALARLPDSERAVLSVETPAGATARDAITEPALYVFAFTPAKALPNTTRKSLSYLADFHDFLDGKALCHHVKLIEISWLQLKGAFMDLFPGHPNLLRRTEKAVQGAVDEADEFLRRHGEKPRLPSDPGDLTRH
jgi:prophage antirepressor-like protein